MKKFLNVALLAAVFMALFAVNAMGQVENRYPGQKVEEEVIEFHPYTYAEAFGNAPISAIKQLEFKKFSIVGKGGVNYYSKISLGVKVPKGVMYSNVNRPLCWMDRLLLYKSNGKYYFVFVGGKTLDEVNATLEKIGPPDKK